MHARLDLERASRGRDLVTPATYRARLVSLEHSAGSLVEHHRSLLQGKHDVAFSTITCLANAMHVDVVQGSHETPRLPGGRRSPVSAVSNYIESIRDDPAKMAAWFWMVFIDDVLHVPYSASCTSVYPAAVRHLQPVGVMALIYAFNALTYHATTSDKRRIIDELVLIDRLLFTE